MLLIRSWRSFCEIIARLIGNRSINYRICHLVTFRAKNWQTGFSWLKIQQIGQYWLFIEHTFIDFVNVISCQIELRICRQRFSKTPITNMVKTYHSRRSVDRFCLRDYGNIVSWHSITMEWKVTATHTCPFPMEACFDQSSYYTVYYDGSFCLVSLYSWLLTCQ